MEPSADLSPRDEAIRRLLPRENALIAAARAAKPASPESAGKAALVRALTEGSPASNPSRRSTRLGELLLAPSSSEVSRRLREFLAEPPSQAVQPTLSPAEIEERERQREAFDAMAALPGGIDALRELLEDEARWRARVDEVERQRDADRRAAEVRAEVVERERDAERRRSDRRTVGLGVIAIFGGPTLVGWATDAVSWIAHIV